MALSRDLEGKAYPPTRFTVDPARLRAFADAVGYRGSGLAPTVVTIPEIEAGLANVVTDPQLGIDLANVLHGEQAYAWNRSLAEGETLTAQATIEAIRSKGAMSFLTLRTALRDEAGDVVVTGTSTLIVRVRRDTG